MTIARLTLAIALAAGLGGPPSPKRFPNRSGPEASTGRALRDHGLSTRYMAAAANPLATEAGREMLRAGGSAVDAAIAVQLVLNLVEPQSSGLGGGAFMVHWDAAQRTLTTSTAARPPRPRATPDRFLAPDGKPMQFYDAVVGGRSVGVPGTPHAARRGAQAHGKLPWPQLFEPAIRLAENGFACRPA